MVIPDIAKGKRDFIQAVEIAQPFKQIETVEALLAALQHYEQIEADHSAYFDAAQALEEAYSQALDDNSHNYENCPAWQDLMELEELQDSGDVDKAIYRLREALRPGGITESAFWQKVAKQQYPEHADYIESDFDDRIQYFSAKHCAEANHALAAFLNPEHAVPETETAHSAHHTINTDQLKVLKKALLSR